MIHSRTAFTDAFSDSKYLRQYKTLLKSEDLCYEDLDVCNILKVVVLEDKVMAGFGFEVFGDAALFRSVIVSRELRGTGLGVEIVRQASDQAKINNIKTLYLLTTTADKFFKKFNFEEIPRNSVPHLIGSTAEFKTFCPDTAICMKKEL